jgi:hypothetical protein
LPTCTVSFPAIDPQHPQLSLPVSGNQANIRNSLVFNDQKQLNSLALRRFDLVKRPQFARLSSFIKEECS